MMLDDEAQQLALEVGWQWEGDRWLCPGGCPVEVGAGACVGHGDFPPLDYIRQRRGYL